MRNALERLGARTLALASRSPRRAALLEAAGIPFTVGPFPDVDEAWPAGATAAQGVTQLASAKARAAHALAPEAIVLTADTLVFLGGTPLGKPGSPEDAAAMLARLAGQTHEVWTGVALLPPSAAASGPTRVFARATCTRLTFAALSAAQIAAYVATGEPMGKAGAYALQGGARAFVTAQDGPADNVIGLPVDAVRALIREAVDARA